MQVNNLTLTDLKRGWHPTATGWQCNYCQAQWAADVSQATREQHVTVVHGGNLNQLLHTDSRYNTLTQKQRDLLTAFTTGIKDQDLAKQLQVAAATIRHQKFTFREKAKQARMYLAIYESVFETDASAEPLIDVPEQTRPVDDRFMITEDEAAATLKRYFDFDQQPPQLLRWPKKQKVILIILTRIIDEIPLDQRLTEDTLNQLLKPIYFDYATVRRYLIDYGFLKRTADGQAYWRTATRKD